MLEALLELVRFHRTTGSELIDDAVQDEALLAANFADMHRSNRWLGGIQLTIEALDALMLGRSNRGELSLLDVGTGSLDFPEAVAAWAKEQGVAAQIVASDLSFQILSLFPHSGAIARVTTDARHLPFADGSFDVVASSMLLHHLDRTDAIDALREMGRVARHGVIVNDLVRGRLWYLGALAFSRVTTRNPLTRHDAPLSVRRAYTVREMAELAAMAGLVPVRTRRFLGYRVAMTCKMAGQDAVPAFPSRD